MQSETAEYDTLRLSFSRGVLWVTIDNPPINLFETPLRRDIDELTEAVAQERGTRVVVFQSANPDYFIAHSDVSLFIGREQTVPVKALTLNWVHTLGERLRQMPKVTIAKLEGRARGGGLEFALNLDMRFAARGRAVFAQPETALGIIPGGGGTQRLPRLVGRSRALELILGGDDIDADLAERYGLVNRSLPGAELSDFVDRLALRIATYPEEAITRAKLAIHAAEPDIVPGLLEEAHLFNEAVASNEAARRMRRFLDLGGQTPAFEHDLAEHLTELAADAGEQDQLGA